MATPTYLSTTRPDCDISAANTGAAMLGLPLFDQGLNVARVAESNDVDGLPDYPIVVVLMPRRSTKTTAIWALLLGRCATIPGYKVATTAQDGTRARQRFREVARILEASGFEETDGNVIRWANGSEAIEFANGSRLWVVAPNAGAFRGEAADCLLFDEAGELSPEKSEDLLTGALPLLDTRPRGQAIITGTPAKTRAGLLWDTLEEGRRGDPGVGIVDYSIREDEESTAVDEHGNVSLNEEVLRRVHPGIGTLTTIAKMRQRFNKMQLDQFEREYLCRFPRNLDTMAIDPDAWAAGLRDDITRPERVGCAFDVDKSGNVATVVYAWRDEEGNAYGEVVAHRAGNHWVPAVLKNIAQKHKGQTFAYDSIGANHDVAEKIRTSNIRPKPTVQGSLTMDTTAAALRLSTEIHEGRFYHMPQKDLDAAVDNTGWREAGKGRAFGKRDYSGAAINPVVAISLALWQYDKTKPRKRAVMVG